ALPGAPEVGVVAPARQQPREEVHLVPTDARRSSSNDRVSVSELSRRRFAAASSSTTSWSLTAELTDEPSLRDTTSPARRRTPIVDPPSLLGPSPRRSRAPPSPRRPAPPAPPASAPPPPHRPVPKATASP